MSRASSSAAEIRVDAGGAARHEETVERAELRCRRPWGQQLVREIREDHETDGAVVVDQPAHGLADLLEIRFSDAQREVDDEDTGPVWQE
jgi:hypothetical protein